MGLEDGTSSKRKDHNTGSGGRATNCGRACPREADPCFAVLTKRIDESAARVHPDLRGMIGCEVQQIAGDPGSIVAGGAGFLEIITKNRNHAKRLNGVEIVDDLAGALLGIFCFDLLGSGRAINERIVEELLLRVPIESANVI